MFKTSVLLPIAALVLVQSLDAALPMKELRPGMSFVQVPETKEHAAYWIQQTEATRKHWRAIMKTKPLWEKFDSRTGDDDVAVTYVSWLDVQEYIRKLNDVDFDYVYRLPTEKEWMEASRAGSSREPVNLGSVAWYSNNAQLVKGQNFTHPVAQKAPNAWGLYDCLGNVWEWLQDAGKSDQERMLKGGSWRSSDDMITFSERNYMNTDEYAGDLGFRLAATPVDDGLWSDWLPLDQEGVHLAWRVRWMESSGDGQTIWSLNIRNHEPNPVEVAFSWGLGETIREEGLTLDGGQILEVNAELTRTQKGQRPSLTLVACRPIPVEQEQPTPTEESPAPESVQTHSSLQ